MYTDIRHLFSQSAGPLILAGGVLITGFLVKRIIFHKSAVGQFVCQLLSFAGFSIMLHVAGVVPFKPTPVMGLTITYIVICVFKAIWWLAAAWLLAGFVRAVLIFKRQSVETRFLQDLSTGFIYVGAILGIIAYVFDLPVSGLLAASGVIAIVLGLALQSTLGDLFSGVVLNMAKPYHPGDWVILDAGLEGRVVETNWRATYILTLANDLAIIPNSLVAKARIFNASEPTGKHGITVAFRLDPAVAPSIGVAVLETAMLSCNHILRMPAARVTVRLLDAVALECELMFFVASVEQGPAAQNEVFDRVFRHCISAGIRLAPSATSGFALPLRNPPHDPLDVPRRLLDRLPVFQPLSDAERFSLAPRMTRRTYRAGETIVQQGVVAPALFILGSGALAALQSHGADEIEVFRLAPGDCFAEASVLTGAATTFEVRALTKVVVYGLAKEDLALILKERPIIAAELSQIMARRDEAGKARLAKLDNVGKHDANLAERLTDRVKLAFGLT